MHHLFVHDESQSTSMTVVDEGMLPAHQQPALHHTTEHPETPPAKRRCPGVETQIKDEPIIDFVTKGLISVEHAMACFQTWVHIWFVYFSCELLITEVPCRFFQGCVC